MATDIFKPYLVEPVTAKTYKELGQKIQKYTLTEQRDLLENFHPNELHFQLLKLILSKTMRCQQPLLDGLKSECKYVSHLCVNSRLLYSAGSTKFLDPNFLMPLLQTVSSSVRYKILWKIGKYLSSDKRSEICTEDVDALHEIVSRIWGSSTAVPLLCQTSEELLKKELSHSQNLSNVHLLIVAKRFPSLALSYLQQLASQGAPPPPQKAVRYIVRQTLPESFEYIKKQHSSCLSKNTMKFILRHYVADILETPSGWLNVLDSKIVKRNLGPHQFQLFLFKQLMEVDLNKNILPHNLQKYLRLLSPSESSTLFNKVFQEKYGCNLRSKTEFWEKHEHILRCLEASDRSFIAVELDSKHASSNKWLPLMTTDLSLPRIRKLLSTEQNPLNRARLFYSLIECAVLNKDQKAIEDICYLAVNRYRNDKITVQNFFNSEIDFSILSPETFDLVLAFAKKFFVPNDWQTRSAAKLFAIAITRNWSEEGIKEYINHLLNHTAEFRIENLYNIESQYHPTVVNEVFTTANIENKMKLRQLITFLPLITKWIPISNAVLITDNVKKSILALLNMEYKCQEAIAFVCNHLRVLTPEFVEKCFLACPHEKIFLHLLSRNSLVLSSNECIDKLGKYIIKNGVHEYSPHLRKLRKLGHLKMLHSLSLVSKQVISDTTITNCTNAIILLMLTSDADDYFDVVDPLLPSNAVEALNAAGEGGKQGRFSPFNSSKRQDSIYFGFGLSLSYLAYPSLATERLRRFCVSGDLILFVRDGLYSVCNNLPNETAKVFLLSLMKQPVSVKKHVLRLLWRVVCNIEAEEQLLVQLMETEDHLSIRIILIDTAMALLNICKTDSLWDVVRKIIIKLGPDDQTIIKNLVSQKVPDPFLNEYFQILLEKCKTLQNVDNVNVIYDLLNNIHSCVSLLSEKFIESIIMEFFISEEFFAKRHTYNVVLQLFCEYLQGVPASISNEEQCKNVSGRHQFLKERLDSCVVDGQLDVFDAATGEYPIRTKLFMFVSTFSRHCLNELNKPKLYPLTDYIDYLVSYFANFNQNAVVYHHIVLSITKIFAESPSESAVSLGSKVGDFSDSMLLKHCAGLLSFYPQFIKKFMNSYVIVSPCFKYMSLIDLMHGVLAPVSTAAGTSIQEINHLLRLMIVAHLLPSQWLTDDEYKDFRQTFMARIKNTTIEVFLIGVREV